MELKLSKSSLPITIFFKPSSFFPRHFNLLAQRWKLHIQRISREGQNISKKILVHVVKEGETLNSISKLYGVPILEIADANKDSIVCVDLVSEGQHLNIPPSILRYARLCHAEADKLPKSIPILGFHIRQWNQIIPLPSSSYLPLAKTTGSFLLLVLLLAFCIRCVMAAFQNRVARNSRDRVANKSDSRSKSNSTRWRTLLNESNGAEPEPDSDTFADDQEQLDFFEDVSQYASNAKLEDDYQKFLSECGMSKFGDWRGGSPE